LKPELLGQHHHLSEFDCGEEHLNDWLRYRAWRNEGRYARTFVVSPDDRRVIGYYCLSAGALNRSEASEPLQRNAPDPIPVMILGRFAVDASHQQQGVGSMLLHNALKRALNVSLSIGARGILIHAKDEAVRDYYMRFGFESMLPGEPLTVLLRIETVAQALAAA
jgi:predicted N-acetyltransferase YhbS